MIKMDLLEKEAISFEEYLGDLQEVYKSTEERTITPDKLKEFLSESELALEWFVEEYTSSNLKSLKLLHGANYSTEDIQMDPVGVLNKQMLLTKELLDVLED